MQDFNFYNPTKIIFGTKALSKLSELIPFKKVLLTYGTGSIKRNDTYHNVLEQLKHCEVVEFGGITPNPTYETAMQAVELARKEKVDFILAVGGGSVIDCSKFIAATIRYQGEDPRMLLTGAKDDAQDIIPFGTVLTLPATGSEMNAGAVITLEGIKLSYGHEKLFPQFSILDPSLTFTLSKHQIGNGIVDAYVHVLEQYLTYPHDAPLQDRMAESILLTLREEGLKSYNNPEDYSARANFMWCATMALNSIIGVGVPEDWSTHALGHQITSLYNIDHARTLALIWGRNMQARKANKIDKMLQYAQRVLKLDITDHDKAFEAAISNTNSFFHSVGVPTDFSDYKQIKADFPFKMITRLKTLKMQTLGEKEDLGIAQIMQLLKA